MPSWFLRDSAVALSEPVYHFFIASVQQGLVPRCWKMANIVLVPRKLAHQNLFIRRSEKNFTHAQLKSDSGVVHGPMDVADNYKRIRQAAIWRVERMVNFPCLDWYFPLQALDTWNYVRELFVDYSKAFVYVDHATVISKMTSLGILHFTLKWTHSLLYSLKECNASKLTILFPFGPPQR